MGEKVEDRENLFLIWLGRVAVGVGAIFMEIHEDPDNAPSDGPNMVPLTEASIIKKISKIDKLIK